MKLNPGLAIGALLCPFLCIAQTSNETSATLLGEGSFPFTVAVPPTGANLLSEIPNTGTSEPDLVQARRASISRFAAKLVPLVNPDPTPKSVTGPDPNFFGFTGLTHYDQRTAYYGTQFSLEPPDQALAVGNGFVFEGVNLALAIYDQKSGARIGGPVSISQFFGLFPPIIRVTPPEFGPFVSDPKIYYDHQMKRWFVTVLGEDVDPRKGTATGPTRIYIAVSKTSNPTGGYYFYTINTTDDGKNGSPIHLGCPCLPDQPLIGADAYGFYISTNEFPLFTPGFNGAQIYAMAKISLANGVAPTVSHFSGLPLEEAIAYSVQPAVSVSFAGEPQAGVEYFMSALDFTGTLDNRIAVWALQNTFSLGDLHPSLKLSHVILKSEVYGQPVPALQPPGPTPLGTSVKAPEEALNSNDDRMNQVVFANGQLWGGLNTIVGGLTYSNHTTTFARTGIAYFVVTPSVKGGSLTATMTKQGYVAAPGQDSVMFPSIGATETGHAAMTYTLVGPTGTPVFGNGFYPSMAFSKVNIMTGAGPIQVGGPGAMPDDGFTGYSAYGGNGVARWGDYSAAIADEDGSVWMAAEYIPDSTVFPRTTLANWGTFIGRLFP